MTVAAALAVIEEELQDVRLCLLVCKPLPPVDRARERVSALLDALPALRDRLAPLDVIDADAAVVFAERFGAPLEAPLPRL